MCSFDFRKTGAAALSRLLVCLSIMIYLLATLVERPASVSAQQTPQNLRYDQIKQRFVHNTYSAFRDGYGSIDNIKGVKDEQLLDIMLDYRVRAIELDLHPGAVCGSGFPDQPDWYLYHDCFDIVSSNVPTLRSALSMLKAFHDMQPQHEVVTVNLELGSQKDGKGNESEFWRWSPNDLDNLILAYLGSAVFRPRDLFNYNSMFGNGFTLAEAVKPPEAGGRKGWPFTDELRGKFIFIIHGAGISTDAGSDLKSYFRRPGIQAYNDNLAFEVDEGLWRNLSDLNANYPWMVFHGQVDYSPSSVGRNLRDTLPGHILRSTQIDDGNAGQRYYSDWLRNFYDSDDSAVHFIYMDLVDTWQYPDFRMFNNRFYPFLHNAKVNGAYLNIPASWSYPTVATKAEPGVYLRMADHSGGDIDNGPDKFSFAYANLPTPSGPTESWVVEISSRSNGRVHPHGKGFMMARQSLDPRSPYVAVGRTADRYGLRMQYRRTFDGGREYFEFIPSSRFKENYNVVKLELTRLAGTQTSAKAFASYGGPNAPWEQLGPEVIFDVPLNLKGLAACNNQGYNADNVTSYSPDTLSVFDFIGLRKNGSTVSSNLFQVQTINHTQAPLVWRLDDDGIPCGGQCPKPTSIRITSTTPNPSNLNQIVTINYKLDGVNAGDPMPTGVVTVYAGEATCTGPVTGTPPNITGSCQVFYTIGGSRGIVANYEGDAHYFPSSSPLAYHYINRYNTSSTLSSSANPILFGQPLSLTATIAGTGPGGLRPTGSVVFVLDSFLTAEAPVVNGVASYVWQTPYLGTRMLEAHYQGDGYFEPSVATLNQDVNCPTITVGPDTLAPGTVLAPYSQTLTATGLPANDRAFYIEGINYLPPGLELGVVSGVLSGTPQAVGTYSFPIGVSDLGSNCRGAREYTLTIACPAITLAALPTAHLGASYSQPVTAAPAGGEYVYAITTGALPPGLTFNTATGLVSGTATQSGTFNFTIKATGFKGVTGPPDEAGNYNFINGVCQGSRAYSLRVTPACQAIALNPSALPNGTAGTNYNQTLSANGGVSPYNFTVNAGTLPSGMTLSAAGVLSGAPTVFGTFNFTAQATDANDCQGARAYTLTINAPCPSITVNPASLPDGTVGAAYNQMLTATGGTAPYSYAVSAGTLPGGLSLSSGGVLTGMPSVAGAFNFSIKATDANNCQGTRAYTVTINSAVTNNGLQFYPLSHPVRLLDTRAGQTGCDAPGAAINGGTARTQTAAGRACGGLLIPATARALTGNVTTVQSGGGYLTLYPSDAAQPLVANSNYQANEILNNVFTVGLGANDGAFKIFVTSNTHLVVDVTGYYAPPAAGGLYFHPLPKPIRLLETRAGFGGCNTPGVPLPGNADTAQQGRLTCDGVTVPNGARALVGNATTVNPQGGGYLTLYPAGAQRPLVASSNFNAGQIINAPFTVGLSAAGEFNIFTTATTELVIDVSGYYSAEASDSNGAGLLFNPLPHPIRLLETRVGLMGCDTPGAPIQGDSTRPEMARLTCDGVTIANTARGIVGNATVVNPGGGYLTFWPSNAVQPLVATSNYQTGQVFNRHFTAGLGTDGAFKIFASATTDLVIDVAGFFAP